MKRCPVCKCKNLNVEQDAYNGILHEEHISCRQCGMYEYSFVTGYYREDINGKVIDISYSSSNTAWKKYYFIRKKLMLKTRKKWSKMNNGLNVVSLEKCKWCNGSGFDIEIMNKCYDCEGTGYTFKKDAIRYLLDLCEKAFKLYRR